MEFHTNIWYLVKTKPRMEEMAEINLNHQKIMLRGSWKSETSAMRYLQSWSNQDWLIVANHRN